MSRSLGTPTSAQNYRECHNDDPDGSQYLQNPVTEDDLFWLTGRRRVDVYGVAQNRQGDGNHRDREPRSGLTVPLECPKPVKHDDSSR